MLRIIRVPPSGDCVQVMKHFPSQSIGAVITDPLYLVNYQTCDRRGYRNDAPNRPWWAAPAFAGSYRVMKDNSFCVSFYGWTQVEHFMTAWKQVGFRPLLPAGCPPTSWRHCPRSCTRGPKPMAFGDTSGPVAGSPRRFAWRVASPTIPSVWAACAERSAGARKRPPDVPPSVTKPPLPAGGKTPGQPSKRGAGPAANHLFYRRLRGLSLAQRRPHLCPSGTHTHRAGGVNA